MVQITVTDKPEAHSSQKETGKVSRISYDAKFKLMAVAYATNTNNVSAAKYFGVTECNIRRWKLQQARLKNTSSCRKAFRGPTAGHFPDIDREVLEYCLDLRGKGLSVTREEMMIKAAQTARGMGIARDQFKASIGWVKRFMRRSGLCLRRKTTLAQRLPQEYEEKLLEYQKYVINIRKKYDHQIAQIGNADETPIYFEMPANTTVDLKGAKSVTVKTAGHEKKRCTVMLGALGDGRKLPPFVIFKRKTLPKEVLPAGIIVRVQEKGWMDEELMLDWLNSVWNKRPGALFQPRALLSLDSFKGHLTEKVKDSIKNDNTDLVVIPGGMTSQLQVMDVCLNKPFKDHFRKEYKEWLVNGPHEFTAGGKIKKPSCALICQWILSAWSCIETKTIIHGFKKCCLTNAMDGTEDDIWEEPVSSSEDESSEDNVESDDNTCDGSD